MSLARRVRSAFSPAVRRRGETYVREGRVSLTSVEEEAAHARVRGSSAARYEVTLRVAEAPLPEGARRGSAPQALGLACTCPHFAGGELCKHLWGTVLLLDRQGWLPAILADEDGPDLLDLDDLTEPGEPGELFDFWGPSDDEPFDEDEEDDDALLLDEVLARALEARLRRGPRGRPPRAVPTPTLAPARGARPSRREGDGWRRRLSRLAPAFPRRTGPAGARRGNGLPLGGAAEPSEPGAPTPFDERLAALAGAPPPLHYLIDPEEARRDSIWRIHFARRAVRRDGSLGALRPAGLGPEALEAAASREEGALQMQLLALGETEAALGGAFYTRSDRPSSVSIPPGLADPLLPRLAETGRLAALPGGFRPRAARGPDAPSPEPRSLRLDPGPAWELRLELVPAPPSPDGPATAPSEGRAAHATSPTRTSHTTRKGRAAADEPGYLLRGRFARGDESLPLEAPELVVTAGLFVHGGVLARADLGGDAAPVGELRRAPLHIPARELDDAVAALADTPGLPPLELAPGLSWDERPGTPLPRLRFEGIEPAPAPAAGTRSGARRRPERRRAARARGEALAHLEFGYGDTWVPVDAVGERVADRGARTLVARDSRAEWAALQTLAELGFRPTRDGRAHAPRAASGPLGGRGGGETPTLALDLDRFEAVADQLLAKGWRLEADGARLHRAGRSWASVRSGVDFFDLEGGVDFDGQEVPFPTLLAAAREQAEAARFVRLGDGSRGLLPRAWIERCAALAALAAVPDGEGEGDGEGDGGPGAPERLRFSRAQVGLVGALLDAQDASRADRRFATLRRSLEGFRGIAPAREPRGFRGSLRDYQRQGLAWLGFLRRFGLGGCLADDMGLGKTVQVLALLAGLPRRRGGRHRPCLVVAPRSVAHGWLAEAERFAPRLRAVRYTGPERRALRPGIEGAAGPPPDLVVTTYGTLRRDVDWLAEQTFDTVVLDEAQAIKNAASRTARAARELRAQHRLALTGTPVENHLGELASLLGFLNPGMLGRARGLDALARGRAPGDDPGDLSLLSRALRPLLLRRTKEQVLRELPPRTEQTLLCELPAAQRRRYDELRRHYRASLGRRLDDHGLARSKIHVLEALLRLRQAACHPALLDPRLAGQGSAKLEALFEHLEEILDEGHKALVFSQFTKLLALVRRELEAREIPYAYLDGRTRDRRARVTRFQEDPDCRVFAISLKAGGTGLNLTAADYVFLLDPWWNPAVEAQAIDRTHRIGQTRPVLAYRLVAEDTVEEKILALQEQKRALTQAVLGDEKSFLGQLDAEDLRYLLG